MSTSPTASPNTRALWVMLLALCTGFALSQAYRTVAAMMAKPLQTEFALTPSELGLFAATFHFMFGAMQIFMGIGIDLQGVRRTVLTAFPLAVAGSFLCWLAPSFAWVIVGQALIGVGCAPAFLVCTVFIAKRFPAHRFAAVSGLVMGVGGLGMLATGTPLAWLVDHASWRAGYLVLGIGAALAWVTMHALVHEPAPQTAPGEQRESPLQALRKFGVLFTLPHTWGILLLSGVTYASFITLRGLWLAPMLIERDGFSLVQSGNVALAVSVVSLVGPALFGRLRFVGKQRRRWITGFTLGMALLYVGIAFSPSAFFTVGLSLLTGFVSGYIVLQYADTRASYPENLTGRALAIFTMAMFLGIAFMQWITGAVASWATGHGLDPFVAVNSTVAAMLAIGALGYQVLPADVAER